MTPVLAPLLAGSLCAAATPGVIRWLRQTNTLDVPNARSSHVLSIPRGGGVSVMLSVVVSVFIVGAAGTTARGLLVVAVALGVVGLLDDRHGLKPMSRLVFQFVMAAGISFIVSRVAGAGAPVIILAAVFLVYMVNAFNFMDGINGISGLHGLLFSMVLATQFLLLDELDLSLIALSLAGACAGFLPYNFPKARVFLGDVGSYFVGGLTSGLAMLAIAHGANWAITLSVFGYYILDTSFTLVVRIAGRKNILEAHRDHAYQLLIRAGWSHAQTSFFTVLLSLCTLGVAVVLTAFLHEWVAVLVVVASIALTLGGLRHRFVVPEAVS